MKFEGLIQEFEISCRAAGLSEKTIQWYLGALRHYQSFAAKCDEPPCTVRSLRRYFAALRTQNPYENHSYPLHGRSLHVRGDHPGPRTRPQAILQLAR